MAKSPVLGAAFGLFAVWWGLSFVAYLATGRIWSGEEWIEASTQAWAGLVGGGLLGLGATAAVVLGARQWRVAKLTGDNVRGVVCSIGPLPINFDRPAEAEELPEAEKLRLPGPDFDLDSKIDREWMEKWFVKYEQDFPEHAALMRAVARVLNSKPELPAACRKLAKGVRRYQYGFDSHMHGNHTLVEHSWICASVGIWLADHGYKYTGLQFQTRDKQDVGYLPKKNKEYQFKAFDPLIGLICFAHDIGKIETFRMNEEGKVEVIEPAHDSVGARMLARMDEFWALPFEDRMTLTLAIGHYHKPGQIPLRRDGDAPNKAEALSDRTMAMLSLVMLADEEAGAIENKKSVLNGENQPREIEEDVYREDLWFAFKDLLSEAQRIHNEPSRYRIGQKNTTSTGTLITLKEGDLRKALLEKMELKKSVKESTTVSGSVQITEDLLEVLDAKGCLVKEAGGMTVSAKEAIWKVEFLGKDKTKAGEVIATWPYAILINPEEHFPRLASGSDAQSIPRVVQIADRSTMGEERKARKPPGMNALSEAPLVDADGVFIIPDGTKDKKNKMPKRQRSSGEGDQQDGGSHEGKGRIVDLVADDDGVFTIPEGTKSKGAKQQRSPEPGHQSASATDTGENIVDLDTARQHAVKATARAQADRNADEEAASTVAQAPSKSSEERGSGTRSSAADFLDDADPLAPSGAERKQREGVQSGSETAAVPAQDASEQGQGAGAAAVGIVQQILRNKVREAADGGQPTQRDASPVASQQADESELPNDILVLTDVMRTALSRLDEAVENGRLAGDALPDGRKGYSLDALNATVPMIREKLQDAALVRRLVTAGKAGPHVPVCITRKGEGNVMLLVVNDRALRKAKRPPAQ